jgi:Domain of unknown function (DUF4907)
MGQLATADTTARPFPDASAHQHAELTYRIIDAPNATFGYDILSAGTLLIHQPSLPGRNGNDGCRTKADAEKLAVFVIGKIRSGVMPPSITRDELLHLRILH